MLTVITGPPCSGKSTYARKNALPGDVVIDFDVLAQALGSPATHGHQDHIAAVAAEARHAAIGEAIRQHHKGHRVWIVDTAPGDKRRAQYRIAGARIVALSADRAELHRRADAERPPSWHAAIDQHLDSNGGDPGLAPVTRW